MKREELLKTNNEKEKVETKNQKLMDLGFFLKVSLSKTNSKNQNILENIAQNNYGKKSKMKM